jgi:hypothetical protein
MIILKCMVQTFKIPLGQNEFMIDSWDLYYAFPEGKDYFGTMSITNKRLLFEMNTHEITDEFVKKSEIFTNPITNVVQIIKDRIISVNADTSNNNKKVLLVFDNGETHYLNRKMLSIDKVVEALVRK